MFLYTWLQFVCLLLMLRIAVIAAILLNGKISRKKITPSKLLQSAKWRHHSGLIYSTATWWQLQKVFHSLETGDGLYFAIACPHICSTRISTYEMSTTKWSFFYILLFLCLFIGSTCILTQQCGPCILNEWLLNWWIFMNTKWLEWLVKRTQYKWQHLWVRDCYCCVLFGTEIKIQHRSWHTLLEMHPRLKRHSINVRKYGAHVCNEFIDRNLFSFSLWNWKSSGISAQS